MRASQWLLAYLIPLGSTVSPAFAGSGAALTIDGIGGKMSGVSASFQGGSLLLKASPSENSPLQAVQNQHEISNLLKQGRSIQLSANNGAGTDIKLLSDDGKLLRHISTQSSENNVTYTGLPEVDEAHTLPLINLETVDKVAQLLNQPATQAEAPDIQPSITVSTVAGETDTRVVYDFLTHGEQMTVTLDAGSAITTLDYKGPRSVPTENSTSSHSNEQTHSQSDAATQHPQSSSAGTTSSKAVIYTSSTSPSPSNTPALTTTGAHYASTTTTRPEVGPTPMRGLRPAGRLDKKYNEMVRQGRVPIRE